jgi:hypothetical protein
MTLKCEWISLFRLVLDFRAGGQILDSSEITDKAQATASLLEETIGDTMLRAM